MCLEPALKTSSDIHLTIVTRSDHASTRFTALVRTSEGAAVLNGSTRRPELSRSVADIGRSAEEGCASTAASCVEAVPLPFRRRSASRGEAILGDADTVMIPKLDLSDGGVRVDVIMENRSLYVQNQHTTVVYCSRFVLVIVKNDVHDTELIDF